MPYCDIGVSGILCPNINALSFSQSNAGS